MSFLQNLHISRYKTRSYHSVSPPRREPTPVEYAPLVQTKSRQTKWLATKSRPKTKWLATKMASRQHLEATPNPWGHAQEPCLWRTGFMFGWWLLTPNGSKLMYRSSYNGYLWWRFLNLGVVIYDLFIYKFVLDVLFCIKSWRTKRDRAVYTRTGPGINESVCWLVWCHRHDIST